MGGDFGLETICNRHELVVFDQSALYSPFRGRVVYRNDACLGTFADSLMKCQHRMVAQALWNCFKQKDNLRRNNDYIAARMARIFDGRNAGVGHKRQYWLRKRCLSVSRKLAVSEEDRYSLFFAVSTVRDTERAKARNTAYVAGHAKNVDAFKELLKMPGVVKEKAFAYAWNNVCYASVDSVV